MRCRAVGDHDDLQRDPEASAFGEQPTRAQRFVVRMSSDHAESRDRGEVELRDIGRISPLPPVGGGGSGGSRVEDHHGALPVAASADPSNASSFSAWCCRM
jgi:hypothetical protein